MPDDETVRLLEHSLNDWFAAHKRGRTAKVFIFPDEDATRFMVRHGEPFKREGSVVGSEASSVAYRPITHDVLVYNHALRELGIHAELKGEIELYRTEFGKHFFGGVGYFGGGAKYSLEPLRTDEENALICSDVTGIEWIKLKEIYYKWAGDLKEYEIIGATDLFAAMKRRQRDIPDGTLLAKATFIVKFKGAKRPRTVGIRPPRVAQYMRDDDSNLIEEWLQKRGFLNVFDFPNDSSADPLLVRP